MLGRTAGGLYWMFRFLERAENTARLVDAGHRIALTRAAASQEEWASIVATAGVRQAYLQQHGSFDGAAITNFLLRERANGSSVLSSIESARNNARSVRTALTREVWEATNEAYLILRDLLDEPVSERTLPETLALVRQQTAQVRGALYGTMLRNDIFFFCHLGALIERADNTARILDVKYYVLLPSPALVGSSVDNVQWDIILRAVSAQRSFRWLNGEVTAHGIAEFLILDGRMPRSLAHCYYGLIDNLRRLSREYGFDAPCIKLASAGNNRLADITMEEIFSGGLHEFLSNFIRENNALGSAIERDYRFYE